MKRIRSFTVCVDKNSFISYYYVALSYKDMNGLKEGVFDTHWSTIHTIGQVQEYFDRDDTYIVSDIFCTKPVRKKK